MSDLGERVAAALRRAADKLRVRGAGAGDGRASPRLKVVPFPPPTPQTHALVETLRACLEQAERGDAEAFILVMTKRNGDVMRAHCRAPDSDAFKLLGVLTHESRWLSQLIDKQNEIVDNLDPEGAA